MGRILVVAGIGYLVFVVLLALPAGDAIALIAGAVIGVEMLLKEEHKP